MKIKLLLSSLFSISLVILVCTFYLKNKQKNTSQISSSNLSKNQSSKIESGFLDPQNHSKILIAYFSRTGEQYAVGNIKEGNTAVIAKMIQQKMGGDLFEIKVAKDSYPTDSYTKLTEVGKSEQEKKARPKLAGKVENFDSYTTIFIGYPTWWGDKPMAVYTFIESYNFKGKTLIPFSTHEGTGFCGTRGMESLGAKLLKGIGIYGHVAQNERVEAKKQVHAWLKEIGF